MPQARFDADAYLVWEAEQADKSEYVAGEVFAMVDVRRVHATVAGNVFAALRDHLRGSPCLPFVSDMKLPVLAADAFFYPDVMVTCDPRDRRVEVFRRQPGNEWLLHDDAGEPACVFASVKLTLGLDVVFEDVETPAADA